MAIWDQLENESNAAYARFLSYRNLGPMRTLQKAYEAYQAAQPVRNRKKAQSPTGTWNEDSATYNWRERATAWDVDALLNQGERTATLYMAAVSAYVEMVYEALSERVIRPNDFDSLSKSIELLHKLLPGETIGAIIAAAEERRQQSTANDRNA